MSRRLFRSPCKKTMRGDIHGGRVAEVIARCRLRRRHHNHPYHAERFPKRVAGARAGSRRTLSAARNGSCSSAIPQATLDLVSSATRPERTAPSRCTNAGHVSCWPSTKQQILCLGSFASRARALPADPRQLQIAARNSFLALLYKSSAGLRGGTVSVRRALLLQASQVVVASRSLD